MKVEEHRQVTTKSHVSLCLKGGTILLLLLLSTLIIACNANDTTNTPVLASPQATLTIHFGTNMLSPVPTVAAYLCGAWITNSTPTFKPGSKIPVYAHFIHNVDGNPVGVDGANARASVEWADGYTDSEIAITQSDGLVVFYFTIPNRPEMVNRNNLVMVSFTSPNGETCNVDNQPQPAAFFTLIKGTSTPQASPPSSPPKRHKRGG